jgi:murein DD-endopeptidase MepM/ murein hydrolase activator NlpD
LFRFKDFNGLLGGHHKGKLALGLLVCLALVMPVSVVLASRSQSVSALRSRKHSLEQQAHNAKQKKDENLRQVQAVNDTIAQNQEKLENTENDLTLQQQRLDQIKQQLIYLTQRLDKTEDEQKDLIAQTSQRLKNLYTGERLSMLQMILDAQDLSTLLDRLYFKQKLVGQDRLLLERLRGKTQELYRQRKVLALQKQDVSATIAKINDEQSQITQRLAIDKELRNKYATNAQFYENAENQLLGESGSIQQQILNLVAARRPRAGKSPSAPIHGNTGVFSWPVNGTVTSNFGYRFHPLHRVRAMHTGLDIAGPYGSTVRATDGGEVIYSGWRGGYGKVVMIDHGTQNGIGIVSLYGHLSQLRVSVGQSVSKGQTVAATGSTGYSTGPHLHFEIRENGAPVDPYRYLR